MINISLGEKEKKILNIAYLEFLCENSGCEEHRDLLELRRLQKEDIKELDKIIESKKIEKVSEEYQKAKKEMNENSPFVRLYGYPLSLADDTMNIELVKKILLINVDEIKSTLSSDAKMVEIQFYYCLNELYKVIHRSNNLDEIISWYKKWFFAILQFLSIKETKKGKCIKSNKIFNQKEFEDEVIVNRNYIYFERIYNKYEKILNEIHLFLGALFNYKSYFKNQKLKYILASLMKVDVCPYCNRQYISVVDKYERVTLTFDHYKREAVFPLLKLSLYNLIPSCYICNSLFKNVNDLEHLYPWKESSGGLRFTYEKEGEDVDVIKKYYDMNNCDRIVDVQISIDNSLCQEHALNSVQVFKLREVYQIHNRYASMLVAKAMKYERGRYRKDIFKILKDNNILTNEMELDEYLYGMNFQKGNVDENAKGIPLYKLSSDIINEIKEMG